MFEQGGGGRDRKPPIPEAMAGLVCYITVSGFLNGPGFQQMRRELRRECDDIWVIDCSPEKFRPKVTTRIFQGVKHEVCIVLASRSPNHSDDTPARVRFRALAPGPRHLKFKELIGITLAAEGWRDVSIDWRAPFLPEFAGGWADLVPLENVIEDLGSGVMPGRTWAISPDRKTLEDRWSK